ncbi:MAG: hypothetical protein H8D92_02390 [Pelagibacteraceae bacterium]|nr:hypothetical protein [Pelagibacteraceae bacterium]
MSSFKRDLSKGKDIERRALKIVKELWNDARIIDGYCKEWDIYIPSENLGVEVKSDEKSKETGNIVIETSFGGKPSAINTTKSSIWIFYTGDKFFLTTPKRIWETIKEKNYREVTFTGKGDYKSKTAYLVRKDDLVQNSIQVLDPDLYL